MSDQTAPTVGAPPSDAVPPVHPAALRAVLEHPDHRAGLGEHRWRIDGVETVAPGLVRLRGRLDGDDDLDEWTGPNVAIRIALPEPPPELAGVEGAPGTTSRVYTVAGIDPAARRIDVDVVRHGDDSPMMRWLDGLGIGDEVVVTGPRPHRVPGPGSRRILLADSSALPAARSIIEWMPPAATTMLVAAVGPGELDWAEGLDGVEVRRVDRDDASPLAAAFAALEVDADTSVWAAGERDDVRELRRRCRQELGLPAERVQVFGYWKRGTSGTALDLARLRAAAARLEGGRGLDLDDFEVDA